MPRTAERTWTHDRTGWDHVGSLGTPRTYWSKPGPWHDEPDKVQWVDKATGYAALAVRNHFGAWCGYVGIPEGHPLYGRDYDDVDNVDVHGGLTYAAPCQEEAVEGHGICHIPEPGHPDNVWWLGFDCGHAFDYQPRWPVLDMPHLHDGEVYRDLAYVQEECERLAAQLHTAANVPA